MASWDGRMKWKPSWGWRLRWKPSWSRRLRLKSSWSRCARYFNRELQMSFFCRWDPRCEICRNFILEKVISWNQGFRRVWIGGLGPWLFIGSGTVIPANLLSNVSWRKVMFISVVKYPGGSRRTWGSFDVTGRWGNGYSGMLKRLIFTLAAVVLKWVRFPSLGNRKMYNEVSYGFKNSVSQLATGYILPKVIEHHWRIIKARMLYASDSKGKFRCVMKREEEREGKASFIIHVYCIFSTIKQSY